MGFTMKRKSKKRANGPDVKKVPISATVLPEKRERLEEIARAEQRDLSQVVRIAIDEYLLRKAS